MRTNAFLRDMDLGPINPLDARRLGVVVDGLALFGGAQLAVDTTLVCPLTRDGAAKPRAATMSGACPEVARRRKEARYPELVGNQGRARLVVLAGEVGGRFSSETAQFLRDFANAKVREVPQLLKGRVHAGSEGGAPCWRAQLSARSLFLSWEGTPLWEWTGQHRQCSQCWVMTVTQCEARCFFL